MTWTYPCPGCGSQTAVHHPGCEYVGTDSSTLKRAYIDVITVLLDAPGGLAFDALASRVTSMLDGEGWRAVHEDALHELKRQRFVEEVNGTITFRHPDERAGELVPTFEPMRTVYECGPVDGCKDNAVYSMVSWCEMKDLDWDQTCAFVRRWLEETGGWDRGDWAESSIGELLTNKRHVHREGLGWMNKAEAAQHVIENSDVDPQLDANADAGEIDPEEL